MTCTQLGDGIVVCTAQVTRPERCTGRGTRVTACCVQRRPLCTLIVQFTTDPWYEVEAIYNCAPSQGCSIDRSMRRGAAGRAQWREGL